MRNQSRPVLLIGLIVLVLVLPGTPVQAYGPGTTNATIGGTDTYWSGNWSTVYVHLDSSTDPWTTGVSFYNLSYRDFGFNDNTYDFYVKNLTIAWVGIRYVGDDSMTLYPHDDDGGSMNNRLLFVGPFDQQGVFTGYQESNNQPNAPSVLSAIYELDLNGNGQLDFQFEEKIELYGSGGPGGHGYIYIAIRIIQSPNNYNVLVNGILKHIERIRYGFLMDCDVYDSSSNTFYRWDNTINQWVQQQNECAGVTNIKDASGRCAKFYNAAATRQIAAIETADAHTWAHWHAVQSHSNEFSQTAETYENQESLSNTNGQLWCDEEYDLANDQPNGWSGFKFCDFDA